MIAAELVDEVHVPGRAAELAVGDVLQADVLLQRDDVADRRVLDRAQLVVVDAAGRVVLAGLEQLGRAQQAADVVGPERAAWFALTWLSSFSDSRRCSHDPTAVYNSDGSP